MYKLAATHITNDKGEYIPPTEYKYKISDVLIENKLEAERLRLILCGIFEDMYFKVIEYEQ